MPNFLTMTRQERIKHKRNKLKLSPSYIAKIIGVSRVTYTNWEDGRVIDIAWPKFNKLAEILTTTPEWLEYGLPNDKYLYNDTGGNITRSTEGIHVIKNASIPIFDSSEKNIDSHSLTPEYIDMPAKSRNVLSIKINSENTLCKANMGDAIIIDESAECIPGEEIYIIFKNSPSVICIYHQKKDNKLTCSNEAGKVIFDMTDIQALYPVIAVARNGIIKQRTK